MKKVATKGDILQATFVLMAFMAKSTIIFWLAMIMAIITILINMLNE